MGMGFNSKLDKVLLGALFGFGAVLAPSCGGGGGGGDNINATSSQSSEVSTNTNSSQTGEISINGSSSQTGETNINSSQTNTGEETTTNEAAPAQTNTGEGTTTNEATPAQTNTGEENATNEATPAQTNTGEENATNEAAPAQTNTGEGTTTNETEPAQTNTSEGTATNEATPAQTNTGEENATNEAAPAQTNTGEENATNEAAPAQTNTGEENATNEAAPAQTNTGEGTTTNETEPAQTNTSEETTTNETEPAQTNTSEETSTNETEPAQTNTGEGTTTNEATPAQTNTGEENATNETEPAQTNTSEGTSSSQTNSETTDNYLAYRASLHLVDPANPTNPITVFDKPVEDAITIEKIDSWDSTKRYYSGFHAHKAVFISNGTVYGISLEKGSQTPIPSQITNINEACNIDLSDIDLLKGIGYFEIRTLGADGKCYTSDDGIYWANSEMGPNDTPKDITNLVVVDSIGSGPEINGFLVLDKQNSIFEKCDTSLNNCLQLLSNVKKVHEVGYQPGKGTIAFCISFSDNSAYYYVWDGSTLKDVGLACDPDFWFKAYWISDDNATYAQYNNTIYALSYKDWQKYTLYSENKTIEAITQTYQRLYVKTDSEIIAISKETGDQYSIDSKCDYMPRFISDGNNVYYSCANYDYDNYGNVTVTSKYCVISDNSIIPSCKEDLFIVGNTYSSAGEQISLDDAIPLDYLIVINNNDKNLYSIDKFGKFHKLGLVPKDITDINGVGIGSKVLLAGESCNSTQCQSDIFYADLSQNNTLKRVTNTPDKNEYPVW